MKPDPQHPALGVPTQPTAIPLGLGHGDWVLLAPFGEHPHGRGMQLFTRDDAAAVIEDFSNRPLARLIGLPWYIGHPDHPEFKDRYKDTKAYGRIVALRLGEDGLEGFTRFSRGGREIVVERHFHGHSVNWLCRLDNAGKYRPARLKSVGWTNENNIEVPPILVANEETEDRFAKRHKTQDPELERGQGTGVRNQESEEPTNEPPNEPKMHTKIRDQLILAGLLQPGETSPEQETAALQALFDGFTERGQTISTLQGEVNDLKSKLDTANTELTNEREAKAALEAGKTEALANERKCRALADVRSLVNEGRIAPAGIDVAVEELANSTDYDATLGTYKAREPMKTAEAAKSTGLGTRSPGVREAEQGLRVELANEIAKKENVPFDVAWDRLKQRRKDLFEKVAGA